MSTGKFFTALFLATAFGATIGILDILNASAVSGGGIPVVPLLLVRGGQALFFLAMLTLVPALRCVREAEDI